MREDMRRCQRREERQREDVRVEKMREFEDEITREIAGLVKARLWVLVARLWVLLALRVGRAGLLHAGLAVNFPIRSVWPEAPIIREGNALDFDSILAADQGGNKAPHRAVDKDERDTE